MNDEELCEKGSPICWAVLACIIVMTVSIAIDTWGEWQYRSHAKSEQMFIQCLGGQQIIIDDRVVTCKISKPLVGI